MGALDEYYAMLDAETERIMSRSLDGNSEQQWKAAVDPQPKVTPGQYFRGTGRIAAGVGTGDIPIKNAAGNITGYQPRNRSGGGLTPGLDRLQQMKTDSREGKPLATASGTPGLDAMYAANPLMTKPGAPKIMAGTEQFGPAVPTSPLVIKKRTDLPASNTAGMVQKIFT